jgi:integrase/recombinase XerD
MNERQRRKMDLFLARFVEAMTAWGWSKRTIPGYEQNVRVFLDWLDRETDLVSLAEVAPRTLGAYQTDLLAVETASGGRLSASTQHLRLGAVRAFFGFLSQEGELLINPARQLQLPKRRKSLPQALLTPKEAVHLLESIDTTAPLGLRDRAIIEVLYATGIRASELCALWLVDFDPGSGTLTVRAGKGNKDRVVPLGPIASAVLSDYIARGRARLLGRKAACEIFVSRRGRPLHRGNLPAVVARAARHAGLTKPIRPHRLRHACATHMLKGGADIRHIQKLLGHASLATTEIYTRVEISDLQSVHRRFHPRERGGL